MIICWLDLQLSMQSVSITTNVVGFEFHSWRGILDTTVCELIKYVSDIRQVDGGNQSTRKKPLTCHKSLINFMTTIPLHPLRILKSIVNTFGCTDFTNNILMLSIYMYMYIYLHMSRNKAKNKTKYHTIRTVVKSNKEL